MGIFKNLTKSLKKAAPMIGSAIGMYFGGPLGASIGSGIGSLAAGQDAKQALLNAALAGGATYAMGGKNFGKGFNFDTSGSPFASPKMFGPGEFADTNAITAVKKADTSSILSRLIPESTIGKVALASGIGGLAALGADEPEISGFETRPFPKGEKRLGRGLVDGISFDLNDDKQFQEYFRRVRKNQGFEEYDDPPEDKDEVGIFKASEGGMAEMDMKLPDLTDTRNFAEKMSYNQLRHNVRAGKKGYTESELRMVENELAKREAPKAPMMPMASVGDPSQMMRTFMGGGEVDGPGTGTSDSVPARLSDGEFVLTAKAVRGAGGGDRDIGAARMYEMMSQLEGAA
jgi:hypothetical protein